jgi:hypothetical protein
MRLSQYHIDAIRGSRKRFAYRKRLASFGHIFQQLQGRDVTRDALFECFLKVYNAGYNAGWQARNRTKDTSC